MICLIAMVSSLFGTNIYKLVQEYRFQHASSEIAKEIFASARLASIHGGVIEVHLSQQKKGVELRRTTDEAIPVDTYFFTYSKKFTAVDSFLVDGQQLDKITIRFTPQGTREKTLTVKHREKFHKIPLQLL